MSWETILKAVIVALTTFVSTGLPAILALKKSISERKEAVTETEKEKATNDMLYHAQLLIEAAEKTYDGFDKVMKSQGASAGSVKKESVMTKLQSYAMQNGYDFDSEFWSQKVDSLVATTKAVNAKK